MCCCCEANPTNKKLKAQPLFDLDVSVMYVTVLLRPYRASDMEVSFIQCQLFLTMLTDLS